MTNDERETTLAMLEEAIEKGWMIEASIIAEHLWVVALLAIEDAR